MNKKEISQKVDSFLKDMKQDEKSKNTLKAYKTTIKNFIEFIPDEELTKDTMIEYKENLFDEHPMKVVNQYVIRVNKFLKYLGLDSLTLRKEKLQAQEILSEDDVLTKNELNRLLLKSKKEDMQMYFLIKTLSRTGMRIGELKYITRKRLDAGAYISVTNKAKTRTIIVPKLLRLELLKYIEKNKIKSYVFCDIDGDPLKYQNILSRMKKLFRECNIKKTKAHPHIFRHFFALMYLAQGGNIANLKNVLGHSDIRTTMIYANTSLKELKKEVEDIQW